MSQDDQNRVQQIARGLVGLPGEASECRRALARQLVLHRMSLDDLERRVADHDSALLVAASARSLASGARDMRELADELRALEARGAPPAPRPAPPAPAPREAGALPTWQGLGAPSEQEPREALAPGPADAARTGHEGLDYHALYQRVAARRGRAGEGEAG